MRRAQQLRVLIVTPSLPYPPAWGFGIRVYQMIRQLGLRHRVTLLAYARPHDDDRIRALRATGAVVEVVTREEPTASAKRIAQLASLFSRDSFQRQSLTSAPMQAAIHRLLSTQDFDIIQVESSQMCGFNYQSAAKVLLDEHNIEYELLHRTFRTEPSPVRKLFSWIEYQKFRREEQSSWLRANACILTSDREEQILRKYAPQARTAVVPNGVDVEYYTPSGLEPDVNNLVFVGVMHYRPNADAALYFIREILPRILEARPSLTFTIVGGGAPDELRSLASANVVFTDTVPDTRPYVERAGAFIVPLRMGSGTRLKVLEGLSMYKPIISTSIGCEGIEAVDGQHLLVADDPPAFARGVVRALDDRALAARLGRAGRELVESRYSWTSIVEGLEDFMLSVAQPEPAAQPILNRW